MNAPIEKEVLISVEKLTKDMKYAARHLSKDEARFLVDAYYMMQENRIRSEAQLRSLNETKEPCEVLSWLAGQFDSLEDQVKKALDKYSDYDDLGRWARSVCGIGPVIAAGLLAHIDIKRAPTAGHVWRYAGLDPTCKWVGADEVKKWLADYDASYESLLIACQHFGRNKQSMVNAITDEEGKEQYTKTSISRAISRRPFNAALKTLCWKIGESFVKVKARESDFYGKIYEERKLLEKQKNESGEYSEQAKAIAAARPTHAQATTYKEGKLPDGHIHSRAKRYAVKLFLAHFWEKGRILAGLPVPLPYPIAHLGHAHKIEVPE